MDELCSGYKNKMIYSILHWKNLKDYTKYIFVGPNYSKDTIRIFDKLAKYSYKGLEKNDIDTLEKEIPNYTKKLGKIVEHKTVFIYDFINGDDTIISIRNKLCRYLSTDDDYLLPEEMHLWMKSKNGDFDSYIRFLNTIFRNDDVTDKYNVYYNLKIVLEKSSETEVNDYLKSILDKDDLEIDKKISFDYNKMVASDEMREIYKHKSIILGYLYTRISKSYEYEQIIVVNPFISDIKDNEHVIRDEKSDINSNTLDSYGTIHDNEIHMVTYRDFINNYDGEDKDVKVHKYWNLRSVNIPLNKRRQIYNHCTDSSTVSENLDNDLELIRKKYSDANYKVVKCDLSEYLIMEINSTHMRDHLDLEHIFNIFEVDDTYFPFVRHVIREDYSKFKISKKFIANTRSRLIYNWRIIRYLNRFNYYQKANYLMIKVMLGKNTREDKEKHFTVYLYSNGYMSVEYMMTAQSENAKVMQSHMVLIERLIEKRLAKYTRVKYFVKPETNLIFNPRRAYQSLLRSKIALFNYKINYEVTSKNHSINKLYNIISYYKSYFYSYMKMNGIYMAYKKVDKFVSDQSVENFMQKILEIDKKITYQKKLQYKNMISEIFDMDPEEVINRLDNVRLHEIKNRTYFLYGVDINVYQDKNIYQVSINNLRNVQQLMHISYLMDLMFKQLVNYNELSHIYQTTKSNDELIIFETTDNNQYSGKKDDEKEDMYENDEFGDDLNYLDLDLDMELEGLRQEDEAEKEPETTSVGSKVTLDKSNIQKYAARTGSFKYSNYMTRMREMADPELYKVDDVLSGDQKKNKKRQSLNYSRLCQNTQMKQPYILTKEEFDKIDDKEAITGYIKYRDRYYVCARIWDHKVKKPISVDKFIANGLKSPYTNGEAMPSDKRSKYELGDKYSVIVRENTYWENAEIEKDWPNILKKTGKNMFPGFMRTSSHPKKLCWPCCFINPPSDYDPSIKTMQNFKHPYSTNPRCFVDREDNQVQNKLEDYDELTTRNENYIMSSNSILGNNRYGKLPDNIDILLRNNQDIFVMMDNNSLYEGSNLFLRKGIISDNKTFLRCIASIKGIRYNQLIQSIIENMTPSLFVTLNNGDIVTRFKSKETLPKNYKKFKYFLEFMKRHILFCNMYGITLDDVAEIEDHEDILALENSTKKHAYQRLYIVVSAFQNFLEYCKDDTIMLKRFTLFLDLFSRSMDWLFPKGANILIFYRDTGNIYCNPYMKKGNKPLIMLLTDNTTKFEPIFHVTFKHKISATGIFEINHSLDLSFKEAILIKERTSNIELIHNSQKRSYILSKLIELHKENCRDISDVNVDIKFRLFDAIRVNDSLVKIDEGYAVTKQVVNIINKTIYLITENNTIIPVKPSAILLKVPIVFLEDMHKSISIPFNKLVEQLKELNSLTDRKLRLTPTMFIKKYEESTHINGLLTDGYGIIPINNVLETDAVKVLKLPVIVRNIYLDIDYRIYDLQDYVDNRVTSLDNLAYLEMLYQQFKYEFSRQMIVNKNREIRQNIMNIFNNNLLSIKEKYKQLYPIIYDMMLQISHLSGESVENLGKNLHKELAKTIRVHSCSKLTRMACLGNIFCTYLKKASKNKCKLSLTPELIEKYIATLVEEILRNSKTRIELFEEEYTPEYVKYQNQIEREDELYLTTEDFGKFRNVYRSSKYHDDFDLYDTKNPTNEIHTIQPKYSLIEGDTIRTGSSDDETSISKLRKNSPKLKNVFATVFDKNGKFRAQYKAGPCIFPYIYGNNKQLTYDCNKDKDEGQRCPTEIDENRRAVSWGFCPVDPIKTRVSKKIKDVYASRGKRKGPEFKEGKCIFPFRYHPSYDLSWECINSTKNDNEKWCATSLKYGQNMHRDLPIAADRTDEIYQKKWSWDKLYTDDKHTDFNNDFLKYKTKGFCESAKQKEPVNAVAEISLDDFDVNKCEKTESKGGYSKKVLVNFAQNVLGMDISQLTEKNGKKTKKKPVLCKAIISKYREVRKNVPTTAINDNLLKIYKKDPRQCEKGDKGGGYYLTQLRKMAINHFNMEPDVAKAANKQQLCKFIKPILLAEMANQKNSKHVTKSNHNHKMSKLYLKNPMYCDKGPKSGGYDIKDLKKIATQFFGPTFNLTKKDEICKEIINVLEQEAIESKTPSSDDIWGQSSTPDDEFISGYYSSDPSNEYSYKSRYSLSEKTSKRKSRDSRSSTTSYISKHKVK